MRESKTYFDETWAVNRKRYRKGMTGTGMMVNKDTGYKESANKQGFSAKSKVIFIQRLRACNNFAQICDSIPIQIQTFYDALVLDEKFRDDVNAAGKIPNRPKQLNDALMELRNKDKEQAISTLFNKAKGYQ